MEDRQREFIQVVYLSEEEATASVARDQNHLPLQTVTESGDVAIADKIIPSRVPFNPNEYSTDGMSNDLNHLRTKSTGTSKDSTIPVVVPYTRQRSLDYETMGNMSLSKLRQLSTMPTTDTCSIDLTKFNEDALSSCQKRINESRTSLKTVMKNISNTTERLYSVPPRFKNGTSECSSGSEELGILPGDGNNSTLFPFRRKTSRVPLQSLSYKLYIHAKKRAQSRPSPENLLDIMRNAMVAPNIDVDTSIITINVSGRLFQIRDTKLKSLPDTLLGDDELRERFYVPEKRCYFFSQCSRSFFEIFSYYHNGELKRPSSVPLDTFIAEIKFFQLGDKLVLKILEEEKAYQPRKMGEASPLHHRYRKWSDVLNYPTSSYTAHVFFFVIMVVNMYLIFHNTLLSHAFSSDHQKRVLYAVDVLLNLALMFVFLVRFVISESKKEFILTMYAIIDLFNIFVFIVTAIAYQAGSLEFVNRSGMNASAKVLQVLQIFQLLKFVRSNVTGSLGKALRSSAMEILSIFVIIAACAVFFGILTHFAEAATAEISTGKEGVLIKSVGDGIWFAAVTITTVGYGDMYPVTVAGRICAIICACIGQVIISMLIPIVSVMYQKYYDGKNLNKIVYTKFEEMKQASIMLVDHSEADNVNSLSEQ